MKNKFGKRKEKIMHKVRKFTDEELKFSQNVCEAFETIEKLLDRLPNSREKSIVFSHIEDAMLHVNCAIAETGIIQS